ncbi:hypothetical protein KC331_g7498 [Hortaea werneckii]|uniref:Uncharacterized protein n=1 Tax=Hortaea werneckii TaxID=91943 RepID=A0A3M7BP14_HORWE|nr:hypothetical protein KC331_g7498 [Hortaea werneckii]KAI7715978.1 hypothetical protein KC353_g5704 [Hortaea werneckii]RMY41366.1 hypothetical protein D0865_12305 [Hortaea werneckii]
MHSNAIWQKKALIVFWTVDLIGLFATLVLAGLQTHEYESVLDGHRHGYNYFDGGVAYAAVGVIMIIFTLASFALDITTIVMFTVERFTLAPKFYLAFQSIKTLLWTIMLILTCYGAGLFIGAFYYIISIALVFASIGQLVYGSVVLDRQRTGRLSDKEIRAPQQDGPASGGQADRNPQNPFEDPVPTSSAKGSGAVSWERFDGGEAAEQAYEMHGSADRAA